MIIVFILSNLHIFLLTVYARFLLFDDFVEFLYIDLS